MTKTTYGQRLWQRESYRSTEKSGHDYDQCKQRHSIG